MRLHQLFDISITRPAMAVALLMVIGCSTAAPPEKTPEDLEQIRTEMKATSNRELSGSK